MQLNGQSCPGDLKQDVHLDDIPLRLPDKHMTVFTNDLEFSTTSIDETWRNQLLIRSTHSKLEENQIVQIGQIIASNPGLKQGNRRTIGSGFVIDNMYAITCGHNVYDLKSDTHFTDVYLYIARNGQDAWSYRYKCTTILVHPKYMERDECSRSGFDLAILKLELDSPNSLLK